VDLARSPCGIARLRRVRHAGPPWPSAVAVRGSVGGCAARPHSGSARSCSPTTTATPDARSRSGHAGLPVKRPLRAGPGRGLEDRRLQADGHELRPGAAPHRQAAGGAPAVQAAALRRNGQSHRRALHAERAYAGVACVQKPRPPHRSVPVDLACSSLPREKPTSWAYARLQCAWLADIGPGHRQGDRGKDGGGSGRRPAINSNGWRSPLGQQRKAWWAAATRSWARRWRPGRRPDVLYGSPYVLYGTLKACAISC